MVLPRPFLAWYLFTVKRSFFRYFLWPPLPGFPFFLKDIPGFLIVDVPPCLFMTFISELQRLCFINWFFCLERLPFWAGVRSSRSVSESDVWALTLLLFVETAFGLLFCVWVYSNDRGLWCNLIIRARFLRRRLCFSFYHRHASMR